MPEIRLLSKEKAHKVIYATVRDADEEIHIECRLMNGEKGAFIIVDKDYPEIADKICKLLNNEIE